MPNGSVFTDQALIDRKMCQRSLYYLCKEVLGYNDLVPHVHGDLCDFATNPKYGRFRQATMPRTWFKTWTWTIGKSIWLSLPDEDGIFKENFPYKGPDVRILIASNVIDNAAKMVFKIKQEWMQNERLKAAFPELVPDFNKTRWSDHVAELRRTIKATEGTYTAVGVGGAVISQHFDHIIEDDLVYAKKDDFTGMELMPTQEDIDNAIGWHKLAQSLLVNPKTSCMDNVGTRWAPQDLIWYIRRFEKIYSCFEVAVEDPDTGDTIWPERFPREVLDQIREAQGNRIYETQYLNRPRAGEDIVFKREYVHIHESLDEFPLDMEYKTIVDVAGWGDKKGLARNCILTAGMDSKHHVWVGRLSVGRFNPTQVITIYKDHSRQFKSNILIEEIQYQRAISHFSREEMERTGEWFMQERLPYDGRKDAKNLRIRSLEPMISNGALHILVSMGTLLEELEFYPYSKTVDILDCLGYYLKLAKPVTETPRVENKNPFKMSEIEKELKGRTVSMVKYPFDQQIAAWGKSGSTN